MVRGSDFAARLATNLASSTLPSLLRPEKMHCTRRRAWDGIQPTFPKDLNDDSNNFHALPGCKSRESKAALRTLAARAWHHAETTSATRANAGAPGVDVVTFVQIDASGVEAALARDLERCAAIHAIMARELADGYGLVR